jgi:hypothetical protein
LKKETMTVAPPPTLRSPNALLSKTLKKNSPKLSPRGDLDHVRIEPAGGGHIVTAHYNQAPSTKSQPNPPYPEPQRQVFSGPSAKADALAHASSLLPNAQA